MLEQNRPLLDVHLVVVDRHAAGGKSVRLKVGTRDGLDHTVEAWTLVSGAPSASQASDIAHKTAQVITDELLTRFGVQGTLRM